jgi:quinol monooxygenase YgiN
VDSVIHAHEVRRTTVMQDLFIRTETRDYDTWHAVFTDPTPPTREEYGIHTVAVYRDAHDPNVALLHLRIEDMDRMQEYLSLPGFESTSEAAGVTDRTMWLASER